ncbi:MAG TPA: iron ABC transporter permease [Candidatus Binatia bacterium]
MAKTEHISLPSRASATQTFEGFISGNSIAVFFAWVACAVILLLTILILWMSFCRGLPFDSGFSLDNYTEVLGSEHFWTVILNTIVVGLGTVAITIFFGVPLAWLLNRTDIPLRSLFITMLAVTVIMPGLVKAMGWIMLLSPQVGLINRLLMGIFRLSEAPFDINSLWGIAFIQGLMLTPSMFFLISGPMRSLDSSLEEAAEVVGANRLKTIVWITSPMLRPAILGGIIYIFMTAIAMFEVAGLLGGLSENKILATELFLAIQPFEGSLEIKYGVAGVYGLLIMAPSLLALFFYFQSLKQSHRYAVITGKGYKPKDFPLGGLRYPAILFVLVYLMLAVFLPFAVLLWASLLPSLRMPSAEAWSLVSFKWYTDISYLLGYEVLKNTILLVVWSSVLVLFFSFMISWVVVRTKLRSRRLVDTISMLPHAIPGIGFAFALLIAGIMMAKWLPWVAFYNTIWIIVAGNVLNRLSYATRITNAALVQVQQELEDAAMICGARKWVSMLRVMMPLIRPSLVFAGLWTALLVFREVSMALLLIGPKNKVLATQLWILWRQGDLSQASALSIVLILITGLLILVVQMATGKIGEARSLPQLGGGG